MTTQRDQTIVKLQHPLEVLIVGGGITGAAIALEAARCGLKTGLIEQRDFAWGTSSRSSKLVHGGLRYLKEGQLHLTAQAVKERDALKREAPGLIDPQSFVMAQYPGRKPGKLAVKLGLMLYDVIAGEHTHRVLSAAELNLLAPDLDPRNLSGGMQYWDAKTDDARLVLRVLEEARAEGAITLNYCSARELQRTDGRVVGMEVLDECSGRRFSISAQVVVNATGAWADQLRGQLDAPAKIRPLRGSHLLLPLWCVGVAQAVSFFHPHDGRPVFIYPWEGVALLGTTDVDHSDSLSQEAAITAEETAYLLAALHYQFPHLQIKADDVIAAFAGVRPVIGTGLSDPSKESRDHLVLNEQGLISVTGGKLTTFRPMALDALRAIAETLQKKIPIRWQPVFKPVPVLPFPIGLAESLRSRLSGRYGEQLSQILAAADDKDFQPIGESGTYWIELKLAAQDVTVVHLEDVLLRRTRVGLLLKHGGRAVLPEIRHRIQALLGWSDATWAAEEARYLETWLKYYRAPTTLPALEPYLLAKEKPSYE